ncbi:hypothetical protein Lepto782_11860 [Leptospira interrogans serovar Canicola]|uniref:Uncharacterized protein n=1 Tax=Leptospira interrogans serovar Canicola TaxID=211880 RepID=A0AAQ0AZL7_LEPIR|nr:hypothetical protein Lepto782_11860 [Leptospira interrogans serovar Canicola]
MARKFHNSLARDRAFRFNSFGIFTTIAFAFVILNSFTLVLRKQKHRKNSLFKKLVPSSASNLIKL